jgi:hypothetical protein
MAYDAARGRLVLFGGQYTTPYAPASDVWEWDGSGWREVVPMDPEGDGNPPVYHRAPMVFDPLQGGVVLCTRGLWLWTGTSWRQLDRDVARPPAPAWNGAGAAFDAARGVLVLFSGVYAPTETWEWNGASWRNATPALPSDRAPASNAHAMAYDPVRRRVLSFGGNTTSDLWAWDGTRWELVPTAGTPPPSLMGHTLNWDDVRGELVVHGGFVSPAQDPWDGRTWALRDDAGVLTWHDVTPGTGPAVRTYHAAAWDPGRRRVLLVRFPYPASGAKPAEVRAWTGSVTPEWKLLDVADPEGDGDPTYPGLELSGLVFNRGRDVTVFHRMMPNETWEWDRVSWARRADDADPSPGTRYGAALGTYGTDVILFGGGVGASQGDTWRWDGNAWQELVPSPDPATATTDAFREYAGTAEDPDTGRLFRFGGCASLWGPQLCYPDVWEWTGLTWIRLGGEPWADDEGDGSPLATDAPWGNWHEGGVAWDRGRGSLLFARTMLHTYWEWPRDGASWIRHEIVPNWPGPDTVRFFVYDETIGAPVLLADNGAWELDLDQDAYLPIPLGNVDGISSPTSGRAAFDGAAGKAVIVSGAPVTWEAGTAGGPAHVFHVDYSRANGPDPAACAGGAACPIQQIEVRWAGGGSGPAGDGATLSAWTGEWSSFATSIAAPASAPATGILTWTPASGVPAATLFHGAARELSFALTPDAGTTAAGRAQVATDAVSVTVRYRRP